MQRGPDRSRADPGLPHLGPLGPATDSQLRPARGPGTHRPDAGRHRRPGRRTSGTGAHAAQLHADRGRRHRPGGGQRPHAPDHPRRGDWICARPLSRTPSAPPAWTPDPSPATPPCCSRTTGAAPRPAAWTSSPAPGSIRPSASAPAGNWAPGRKASSPPSWSMPPVPGRTSSPSSAASRSSASSRTGAPRRSSTSTIRSRRPPRSWRRPMTASTSGPKTARS